MSVKSFKFVSPGVFINEIDNSFIPKSADAIGPVIIGRAARGLGMQPVKVESYSDFVNMFGDTVPGKAGGDVSRYGNHQSPMYGTYAAKAWLNANVGPVTYIRLLGAANSAATTAGAAGWQTDSTLAYPGDATTPSDNTYLNGGAYGLFVFPSYTSGSATIGAGYLGAVIYANTSASISLSGTLGAAAAAAVDVTRGGFRGTGIVVASDANNEFTIRVSSSGAPVGWGSSRAKDITFGFDDDKDSFIRKRLNTNAQLVSTAGELFNSTAYQPYWLGGTFEQYLRDNSAIGVSSAAVLLPLGLSGSSATKAPNVMRQDTREAFAGWFIGQDTDNNHTTYDPKKTQKLFKLQGRGHGAWMQRNLKVSIENLRATTSTVSDYGSFSVVIRSISDTDNAVQVVERWDNCNLDPASPNYVARLVGDQYFQWDTTNKRLKLYGEYPNQSKFVYVEMNADVDDGATDATLLPVGYFGPPKFKNVANGSKTTSLANTYVAFSRGAVGAYGGINPVTPASSIAAAHGAENAYLSGAGGAFTGSLGFPKARLRNSASDGGVAAPTNAYWGYQPTREADSTRYDPSTADMHRWWSDAITTDPTSGNSISTTTGVDSWCDIFSLLNLVTSSAPAGQFYYLSGAYEGATPSSYVRPAAGRNLDDLLNLGYNKFTAPFWGGFDGFDIKKPDPVYNKGMAGATVTAVNNYAYNTTKRAIDTVVDPEFVDFNLLAVPGLTNTSLTQHMINVCEERGDAMSLIDLPDVYIPSHEEYKSTKSARIGTTPTNAATALRNRRIDSSYGATFYPWVQTRDENTGRLVWLPPSVAMMGVLGSSQAKSDVWFAPAGFNRGGLSDGAAGIPITAVSERLVSKDRDTLYESRINPIASFPSSGIVVFGQKTLQERNSALDRINVRRLVIFLKKQISILSTQVLFEQNVQATWNRFKSLVEPFLANVRVQFGITDYRLILDESTTTPDLIDQNVMYAKIMIKPARAIEYIAIDFVVLNTGASFDD